MCGCGFAMSILREEETYFYLVLIRLAALISKQMAVAAG
jgi:hypothetical protein